MADWHVESDQHDLWFQHRVYDGETLILNVIAPGTYGRCLAERVVEDHNKVESLTLDRNVWKGSAEHNIEQVKRLMAENRRLREALKEIMEVDLSGDDPHYSSADILQTMAQTALDDEDRRQPVSV